MLRQGMVESTRITFSIKFWFRTAPLEGARSAISWRSAKSEKPMQPHVSWDRGAKRHAPVQVRPRLSPLNMSLASAAAPVPRAAAATAEGASAGVPRTRPPPTATAPGGKGCAGEGRAGEVHRAEAHAGSAAGAAVCWKAHRIVWQQRCRGLRGEGMRGLRLRPALRRLWLQGARRRRERQQRRVCACRHSSSRRRRGCGDRGRSKGSLGAMEGRMHGRGLGGVGVAGCGSVCAFVQLVTIEGGNCRAG